MKSESLALLLVTLLAACATVDAATWHVPSQCPTIQAGIDSASAGDTVLVACGTYYEHDLDLGSGIYLRSQTGDASCVTVDAQQEGRVIRCWQLDSGPTVEGFTFTGGKASVGGGGMFCYESSPSVRNVRFSGNSADYGGGGMYCDYYCLPVLANVVFSDNSVRGDGGGMYCGRGSSPTLTDCAFLDNWAGLRGGGAYCYVSSSPALTNVTFSGNYGVYGGGIYCYYYCSPNIATTRFSGNTGSSGGGGIFCDDHSSPSFANVTFHGNSGSPGGGMYCWHYSVPTLENAIIVFGTLGEAIYCRDANSIPTLTCCDIYGNALGDYTDCIVDQCGINGNFSECPLFCDLGNGDFHLQECSPCAPGNHPDGYDCGLIGTFDVGCECGLPSSVERTTWSSLKALYR